MSTVTFENGTKVNFNGTPTPKDIEEVAAKMGIKSVAQQRQENIDKGLPVSVNEKRVEPTAVGGLFRDALRLPINAARNLYGAGQILKGESESAATAPMSASEVLLGEEKPKFNEYLGKIGGVGLAGQHELAVKREQGIPLEKGEAAAAFGKDLGDAVGQGLEAASYIPAAGAVSDVAKVSLKALLSKVGAKTALKTALRTGAEGATQSGLMTAGTGLQEGKSAGQILKEEALAIPLGFATGVAAGPAGTLLGTGGRLAVKGAKGTANQTSRLAAYLGLKKPSEKMIQKELGGLESAFESFFNQTKTKQKAIALAQRYGVDPKKIFAKFKYIPDVVDSKANFDNVLMRQAPEDIAKRSDAIQTALDAYDAKAPNAGVKADDFEKQVIDEIKNDPQIQQDANVQSSIDHAMKLIADWKTSYMNPDGTFNLGKLNIMRKGANGRTKAFLSPAFENDAENAIGNVIRSLIDNKIETPTVRQLNKEIGEILTAKRIAEKTTGDVVQHGKLTQLFAMGIGASAGRSVADSGAPSLIGTLLGAIGGKEIVRLIQSLHFTSPIRDAILKGLQKDEVLLNKLMSEIPAIEQKAIRKQLESIPQLEAPKAGAFRSVNIGGKTIELPESMIAANTELKALAESQSKIAPVAAGEAIPPEFADYPERYTPADKLPVINAGNNPKKPIVGPVAEFGTNPDVFTGAAGENKYVQAVKKLLGGEKTSTTTLKEGSVNATKGISGDIGKISAAIKKAEIPDEQINDMLAELYPNVERAVIENDLTPALADVVSQGRNVQKYIESFMKNAAKKAKK